MATTQPIREKALIQKLIFYFQAKGQFRNMALVVFALHTGLRIGDLLKLKWDDIYDFGGKHIRSSFVITEGKTHKSKTISINSFVIKIVSIFADRSVKKDGFVFENPKTNKAISRVQAYRIIRGAGEALNFPERISCHSLRKTFGYQCWKNGVDPMIILEIYNHSSFEVTRRYIGITQDEMNAAYKSLNLLEQHSHSSKYTKHKKHQKQKKHGNRASR